MAKDPNTVLSMSELLDALERGQRIYKGFERGLEVARRVANLEGAERDCLARADAATALCVRVEQDCRAKTERVMAEAAEAEGKAAQILAAATEQAAAIVAQAKESAGQALATGQLAVNQKLALLDTYQADLAEVTKKIQSTKAELRKIEQQLEDARAAKRRLLEA